MSKKKISIIIPFCNEYEYILNAVVSASSINKYQYEILIVNDGPSQQSELFLSRIESIKNVQILQHDRNRGLSAARNTGIKKSDSDAIVFLDADDLLSMPNFELQLDMHFQTRSEVTVAPYLLFEEGAPNQKLSRDAKLFSRNKPITNASLYQEPFFQFIVSSWQSVYSPHFLKKLSFDEEQKKFEDRLFVLNTVFETNNVSFYPHPARLYRKRNNSITTSPKNRHEIMMMLALIEKCNKLVEQKSLDQTYVLREKLHSLHRLCSKKEYIFDYINAHKNDSHHVMDRLIPIFEGFNVDSIKSDPVAKSVGLLNLHKLSQKETIKTYREAIDAILDKRVPEYIKMRKSAFKVEIKPKKLQSTEENIDVHIILHLGSHKTGTTMIQNCLFEHRDKFLEHGLLFPKTGFRESDLDDDRACPGHLGLAKAVHKQDSQFFEMLKNEVKSSDCSTVFLSCENLIFQDKEQAQRVQCINYLCKQLKIYKSIEIIYCIRNPLSYLESWYKQRIRGFTASKSIFNSTQFINHWSPILLNYNTLLGPYENALSIDVKYLNYDELRKGGYINNFVKSVLGLELDFHHEKNIYASLSEEEHLVATLIDLSREEKQKKQEFLKRFLSVYRRVKNYSDEEHILMMGQRDKLISCFKELNRNYENKSFNSIKDKVIESLDSHSQSEHVVDISKSLTAIDVYIMLKKLSMLSDTGNLDSFLKKKSSKRKINITKRAKKILRNFFDKISI